jgi:hypothetical protein
MRHGPQFSRLCTVGQMLMFASDASSLCYLKKQMPLGYRPVCGPRPLVCCCPVEAASKLRLRFEEGRIVGIREARLGSG